MKYMNPNFDLIIFIDIQQEIRGRALVQWWSTPHWTKRSSVRADSPHICVGVRLASQRPLPRPHLVWELQSTGSVLFYSARNTDRGNKNLGPTHPKIFISTSPLDRSRIAAFLDDDEIPSAASGCVVEPRVVTISCHWCFAWVSGIFFPFFLNYFDLFSFFLASLFSRWRHVRICT